MPLKTASKARLMHPYHIPEAVDERRYTALRAADQARLVAQARASQRADDPCADSAGRGLRLRIPLIRWELRMQPAPRPGC
ncbi:MAG: hypothetical protein WD557_16155 [Dehalococcoidia bacterium]